MDHHIQISGTQPTIACVYTTTTVFQGDNTLHKGVTHFYSLLVSLETLDPSKPNEMTIEGIVRHTRLTDFIEWNFFIAVFTDSCPHFSPQQSI